MAGYTSRLFLTLTIPSVFGFLSVLYFFNRKKDAIKSVSRAIQVENTEECAEELEHFLTLDPMKLKNNKDDSCEESVSSDMQLKETTQASTPDANGIQQNGKVGKGSGKKSKSKMREKTCTFQKDYILKNGIHHSLEDNEIELAANGVESIDLNATNGSAKDELLMNAINNKYRVDMEITTNGHTNSSPSQNHARVNGDSEGHSTTETDDNLPVLQNGGFAKEQCDTGVLMLSTEDRNSVSGEGEIEKTDLPQTVKIDTREPLTLPVDCTEANGEMLESPGATYCDSVVNTIARVDSSSQENIKNTEYVNNGVQCAECVSALIQESTNPTPKKVVTFAPVVTYASVCASSQRIINAESVDKQVEGTTACVNVSEEKSVKHALPKGSNDSGKGASEIHYDPYQVRPLPIVYEFEIFQEYVGLLIGRNGRHVRYIKEETNADILIKRHPFYERKKVCAVSGTDGEIHAALKLIRKRFPTETYPGVTLSQICIVPYDIQHPDILKLSLPEVVSFDVMLSATVNAGHFFLQQPTHPTFHSLPSLSEQMTTVYNQDINAPPLPHVDRGFVCAANIGTSWYRAEIDEVFEDTDECRVKFLDYGGYVILPRTSLKQIRYDFMCVPFQATECYLGDVTYPDGATDWSREATAAFEELAQGQILQGFIVGYAENRVPYVKLFKVTGVHMIDINEELVRQGFAKSLQPNQQ